MIKTEDKSHTEKQKREKTRAKHVVCMCLGSSVNRLSVRCGFWGTERQMKGSSGCKH